MSRMLLIFLSSAFVAAALDYSDLEALGVTCPQRDKCAGYRFNRHYTDRNCECDSACATYGDCCIDVDRRRSSPSSPPNDDFCLNYGEDRHTGVYVVARCSDTWDGLRQVRLKCEGPPDLSDPLSAAPVTSVSEGVTYKNLFCAECNNADMQSLKTFQFRLSCEGLEDLSQSQIMADLVYDRQRAAWGVNRLTPEGGANFVDCEMTFDAPHYVNASLRFCRANLVSTCAANWTRPLVGAQCGEYMAVVYDESGEAYRNPHCALCNRKGVDEVWCRRGLDLSGKKKPMMPLTMLVDVNGDAEGEGELSTPSCPSGQKYDPFVKRCRRLACALRGHHLVDGRCVPKGG